MMIATVRATTCTRPESTALVTDLSTCTSPRPRAVGYRSTVLVLTEEIGQSVVDADGRSLGRVRELVVDANDPCATVVRLGIRRGRGPLRWVAWNDVVSFERTGVLLRPGAPVVADGGPATNGVGGGPPTELWLWRDVLDTQILDAGGARIERVGDLVLIRVDHGLRVLAVQFGPEPVLRRLGLRRLAARFRTVSVPWNELHLVSSRGLAAQLAAAPAHLDLLTEAQLAALIAQVSTDRASTVLNAVGPGRAADALRLAHPEVRSRVVHALPGPFDAEVVAAMAADDAAATLRRVAPSRRSDLLARLAPAQAAELRALVAAHPGTAKGLMTTGIITAPHGTPVAALRSLLVDRARRGPGPATVFVVDGAGRPLGLLDATDLLGDEAPTPRTVPVLRATTPVDEVIALFATHDLLAAPVVDAEGRVIGAVAIDDVLDELVAERLPGRSRFHHLLARHRRGAGAHRVPR
jgi:CBS domain-containing protein/sporulation protein YlmC with PRC-barrel domain